MSTPLTATIVAAALLGAAPHAQQVASPKPSSSPLTMTGCVSEKPTSGQYTFAEADGFRQYRLNGKGLRKFAGQRVEIIGGSPAGGLTIKGGLWPAPTGGARGVAQDPTQAAIAAQQAATGTASPGQDPEFKVAKVRAIPGACD